MAQYYYSNGKRKNAIARVRLYQEGGGKITVNEKEAKTYFSPLQIENAVSPLRITNLAKQFDIAVQVLGGGKAAQSDAIRLGISRALLIHDPELRPTLKREGFLRRDARIKERKKPGLVKARKAKQWSKR